MKNSIVGYAAAAYPAVTAWSFDCRVAETSLRRDASKRVDVVDAGIDSTAVEARRLWPVPNRSRSARQAITLSVIRGSRTTRDADGSRARRS